ncbi:MAG: flavodoxin domain-containing protein [Caldisericia bacterium]|nr:flavodoxin domain-containing protein [Caldisericia bacterium]
MKVLIAYSSKYGSTREIAEHVCKILQTDGFDVNIEKASASLKMKNYDAIILGSGVYVGKWLPGMENLLKKHFSLLQEKRVWIFSDGPTGKEEPTESIKNWKFPNYLELLLKQINPKGIMVFNGKMLLEDMNMVHKFIIKKMNAPLGDFRDWEAISEWAKSIAEQLEEPNK